MTCIIFIIIIHYNTIYFRTTINYKILFLTCKSHHAFAHLYLSDLLQKYTPSGNLLHSIPHTRLCTFRDRALRVAAPTLWNVPPADICDASALDMFFFLKKTPQTSPAHYNLQPLVREVHLFKGSIPIIPRSLAKEKDIQTICMCFLCISIKI